MFSSISSRLRTIRYNADLESLPVIIIKQRGPQRRRNGKRIMQRGALMHPKLIIIRVRKESQNLAEQRPQPGRWPRRPRIRTSTSTRRAPAHNAHHRRRGQHLVGDIERDEGGAARDRARAQHRRRSLGVDVDVELGGGGGVAEGGAGGGDARGQRRGGQRGGGPAQQAVAAEECGRVRCRDGAREARWQRAV